MPRHLHGAEHALGMRHQDREAAVGGREPGDALRRAVRIVRIALGRLARGCRRSAARPAAARRRAAPRRGTRRSPRRARSRPGCGCPPCRRRTATATRCTSSSTSRASNCSERLRTKCGQCAAPGMSSRRLLIIWQPLHTPSANVSPRAKNAANSSRARALNRIDFAQPSPAPSTSPYEKPPQATKPREVGERAPPGEDVAHVHVERVEAGAVERRRHLDLAVDALLAQDRDRRPRAGRDERRRDVVVGIERRAAARARDRRRRAAASYSWSAASGLSRSRCSACVVADHARCRSTRDSSSTRAPSLRDADALVRRRARRCACSARPAAPARIADGRRRRARAPGRRRPAPRRTARASGVAAPPASSMSRPQRAANAISASVANSAAVGDVVIREQPAVARAAPGSPRRTPRAAPGRRGRARRRRAGRRPARAPSRRAGRWPRRGRSSSSVVSPASRASSGVSARRTSAHRRERRDDQRHRRGDRLVAAVRRATSCASTSSPCRPGC